MAGDWIPMRLDLVEDPAVLEMADMLEETEEFIVGSLHRVWSWASRNCHSGTVTGVTVLSLGRVIRNVEFVRAMVKVGWLVESTDSDGRQSLTFPKWENWLSRSAKARINNARNQQISRVCKKNTDEKPTEKRKQTVTEMSPPDSDERVTTVQDSTEQENNNTPLPPKGETDQVPPKEKPKRSRTPRETTGEYQIPQRLDTPKVRQALADFEAMRASTKKPIKNRNNICRGWETRFIDEQHVLGCIDVAIANEYQGIQPDYVSVGKQIQAQAKPQRELPPTLKWIPPEQR